ncbi:hypothetical protein Tco_0178644 [Tanacetum coccineum]
MSSATSDVTYTSVYSDSEPGRAFWGTDYEEVSEGDIPRVIVLGYDGLPLPASSPRQPEYILVGSEEDRRSTRMIKTEDGRLGLSMDGGDDGDDGYDGDDDDDDSSGDDARDEDEDEEEEEEHLAPADSTVVPADGPVSPPEGTEPGFTTTPSHDITVGARITVRPQASVTLPSEAEVERLLTMTTPSPSPPISLSPPSAGERLASLLAAFPPPSLPTTPSLSLLSPIDRRMVFPVEQLRKRLHCSTICSRYEIGESSTARPARGQGIDYGFVSTVDAEERRQGIRDVGYGIRDTWVDRRAIPLRQHYDVETRVNTRSSRIAGSRAGIHRLLFPTRGCSGWETYGWWRRRLCSRRLELFDRAPPDTATAAEYSHS